MKTGAKLLLFSHTAISLYKFFRILISLNYSCLSKPESSDFERLNARGYNNRNRRYVFSGKRFFRQIEISPLSERRNADFTSSGDNPAPKRYISFVMAASDVMSSPLTMPVAESALPVM